MSEYSSDINTDLYKYRQPIFVTEVTGEDQNFIPLKLNLTGYDFNFDLARPDGTDFRLAERSNGTGVLQMWIAYWNSTDRVATVWFKLPQLLANETKTMYAYWGFDYDSGVSDLRYLLGEAVEDSIVYTDNLALGVNTSGTSPGCVDEHRIFDGDISDGLQFARIEPNGWVQANFTQPTKINKLRFFGTVRGNVAHWESSGFELRASNDDFASEDVLILDVNEVVGGPTWREWFFGNDTEYISYRITNNKIGYEDPDYWHVLEIELMGINEAATVSTSVFIFGDDFNADALDVNKWSTSAGSWTINDSKINLGTDAWIRTITGAISTDPPVNWIVEEGIVGVGNPTSTTVAAHRYRFNGGENVLGIDYFWDGATDRKHDFVTPSSYITYNDVNTGLIIGGYTQNNLAYYEPTDRVYQGMVNRGGTQQTIYTDDLCVGGTASASYNVGIASSAFDDWWASYWWAPADANNWIGYLFTSPKRIARVLVNMDSTYAFTVEGSNASDWVGSWIVLDSYTGPGGYAEYVIIDFDNVDAYSRIRLNIDAPAISGPTISQIEMKEVAGTSGPFDYVDSWERKANRNTEVTSFSIYGEDSSSANGVDIDWVIVRNFEPDSDPTINLVDLWVEHEAIGHQQLDFKEYTSDVTSVNYHHLSDMGGDPYRMSDDVTSSPANIFVSDEEVTEGSIVIDFGRTRYSITDNDYTHYNSANTVEYYNAAKLSDLDTDVHERNYWTTTTTISGWAAIRFPETKDIACLALKAVPALLDGMPNNFKFYGSNTNPRFGGWDDKVLIYEGRARAIEQEQTFYFSTGLTFYKYYILDVLDTHGENIAIQEWGMYEQDGSLGKKAISQLRLHPVTFGGDEYYFPKHIKFLGSNDGHVWDALLPRLGQEVAGKLLETIDRALGQPTAASFGDSSSEYAVDGDDNTWFSTNASVANDCWWTVDLGSEYNIGKIRLVTGHVSELYDFYTSTDGVNWVLQFSNVVIGHTELIFYIDVNCRYIKVKFTASSNWGNWAEIYTLEAYNYITIEQASYVDTPTPFVDYVYGRWSRYSFDNFNSYYLYKITCYDNWRAAEDQIKMAEWEMVERVEEVDNIRILSGSSNNINNIWADPDTTIDIGTLYMTNDSFNTVENDTLIHSEPIEITTSGGFWQDTDQLTNDLTTGGTATASLGPYVGNETAYGAHSAFDNDFGSYWHSVQYSSYPVWIQYQFLTAERVTYLRMYPRSGFTSRMPGDFIIKGSNTGAFISEETDIASITGATYTAGQWTEFNFANSSSYLYYRIHITDKAVGTGTGNYMNIFEIEMKEHVQEWVPEFEIGTVADFNVRL